MRFFLSTLPAVQWGFSTLSGGYFSPRAESWKYTVDHLQANHWKIWMHNAPKQPMAPGIQWAFINLYVCGSSYLHQVRQAGRVCRQRVGRILLDAETLLRQSWTITWTQYDKWNGRMLKFTFKLKVKVDTQQKKKIIWVAFLSDLSF